jgi:hypothetical protein
MNELPPLPPHSQSPEDPLEIEIFADVVSFSIRLSHPQLWKKWVKRYKHNSRTRLNVMAAELLAEAVIKFAQLE